VVSDVARGGECEFEGRLLGSRPRNGARWPLATTAQYWKPRLGALEPYWKPICQKRAGALKTREPDIGRRPMRIEPGVGVRGDSPMRNGR